jgi:hypothetical protein
MFAGKVVRESLGSKVGNDDGKADGRTLSPGVGSDVCALNGKYDGISDGSHVVALVVVPKGRLGLDTAGSSVGPILGPSVGRYDGDCDISTEG